MEEQTNEQTFAEGLLYAKVSFAHRQISVSFWAIENEVLTAYRLTLFTYSYFPDLSVADRAIRPPFSQIIRRYSFSQNEHRSMAFETVGSITIGV